MQVFSFTSVGLAVRSMLFSHMKPMYVKLPLFVFSQVPVKEMETGS